jgi:hypothetical protein
MVHKYLSVLLLCSVPLIGMERGSIIEDIANDLRNDLKHFDEIAKEHDARIEEIERRTGLDLSGERSTLANEAGRIREEYFRRIELQEKLKEEQPAPSQVSPCLDIIELYLKQPDNVLPSTEFRDCIRKYVELIRGN